MCVRVQGFILKAEDLRNGEMARGANEGDLPVLPHFGDYMLTIPFSLVWMAGSFNHRGDLLA
jgi:hypothetical protein